jgi:hypothetical protein
VKVSNGELTELLVWAYKQGFLDATQVLTDSVSINRLRKIDR